MMLQRSTSSLTRRTWLVGVASALVACSTDRPTDAPTPVAAPSRAPLPPPSVSHQPAAPTSASAAPSASSPITKPELRHAPPAGGATVEVRTEHIAPADGGPHWIRIVVPQWDAQGGFPLLVALHGLGEAKKGREPGSWGWVKDYWLDRTMMRLRKPPLTRADFQGFVDPKRLKALNRSLERRPFRGVVVACPYTPDLISERSLDNAEPFASFVVRQVLERVRRGAPVLKTASSTGIDGVSLGGRLALLTALEHASSFGAVGSMQTAIDGDEAAELGKRIAAKLKGGPRLRLLTSDKDYYREAVVALHAGLAKSGFEHDHLVVPGPHAYAFNRGPAAIEMLLWHDRVLRGEPP